MIVRCLVNRAPRSLTSIVIYPRDTWLKIQSHCSPLAVTTDDFAGQVCCWNVHLSLLSTNCFSFCPKSDPIQQMSRFGHIFDTGYSVADLYWKSISHLIMHRTNGHYRIEPQAASNFFLWLARWFLWRLASARYKTLQCHIHRVDEKYK